MAIAPDGDSRGELVGIMGAFAAATLTSGMEYMTPSQIGMVFTAVFFEEEPKYEVGIYAYLFHDTIDSNAFELSPEINGKLFVIDEKLLVLLWQERPDKSMACFSELDEVLASK